MVTRVRSKLSFATVTALSALLAAIVAGAVWSPSASAEAESRSPRPAAAPDRFIVTIDAAQPGKRTRSLEEEYGFETTYRYGAALEGFAAKLAPEEVRALEHDPAVTHVTPDFRVTAADLSSLATGEPVPPPGIRRIGAATETAARNASDVRVAVIDTGVDLDHPDLNVADGTDCISPGTSAEDDSGHGTHVAGTIGAKNDGAGVTGVAPDTRLVAVKALDAQGDGTFSQLICGIDWVTATQTDADPSNDIAVANMSLSGPSTPLGSCATTSDLLHKAICRSTAAGVTYVAAAGNDSWDFDHPKVPDVPAAYPQVLTVTAMGDSDGRGGGLGSAPCATDQPDDRYAAFTNYAARPSGAAHTIAAPGVCIKSTSLNGGYATQSGTSMAAPHAAGAVALCISEGGVKGPCADRAPAEMITSLRNAAAARTTAQPESGYIGDPIRPVPNVYLGYLAFVRDAGATDPEPPPSVRLTTASPGPGGAVVAGGTVEYVAGLERQGLIGRPLEVELDLVADAPLGTSVLPPAPVIVSFEPGQIESQARFTVDVPESASAGVATYHFTASWKTGQTEDATTLTAVTPPRSFTIRSADDPDGDGVLNAGDPCPEVAHPMGCPRYKRTVSLRRLARTGVLKGTVTAKAPACVAEQTVHLMRLRRKGDQLVDSATTNALGAYRFSYQARRGEYVARVPERVIPEVGQCGAAASTVAQAG